MAQAEAVGGRAHARLGEPLPPTAGAVGEERSKLCGSGSFRFCYQSLPTNNFGIGSNQISSLENVSRPLLGITWRYENNFQMNPGPNTNGHPENTDKWDVGPFHINVHWTEAGAAKGEVSFDGLSRSVVYGYRVAGPEGEDPTYPGYGVPGSFDGIPLANGRMAARRLNAFGGSDKNKAMMYAPPDHTEGSGKNKHLVATRTGRGSNYDKYAPALARFFDCYNH